MEGYQSNTACILAYLSLFQALAAEEVDAKDCIAQWEQIQYGEITTDESIPLAPCILCRRFELCTRDFLLVMAALALEMDGKLRGGFRRRYGLNLPTVEYGLQLIAPLCPTQCESLAELAGRNVLCDLLLTTAELTAYPLERPLILCRTVLAFLTGMSVAETCGCSPLLADDTQWMPLHQEAQRQVEVWYANEANIPLCLSAPSGAGRRTLLRRVCGNVICADLNVLAPLSHLDRVHAMQELGALAILLSAPVCILADGTKEGLRELERLCRYFGCPTAVLCGENEIPEGIYEVVRLPRQLTTLQRETVWQAFAPDAAPDATPSGAMTVGAVRETALLSMRSAAEEGRDTITRNDLRGALLLRSGAMEFGVRYDVSVTLEDMVLPQEIREQIGLICQAAQGGAALADWGIPQQQEGVTAVFHGPSGTGKTMAACAIANRLGMPLLRADLSQLMDKYVGETEKHLGRLLRSARENHCVILFDEADSLFGKRATVSTGQDKYANLSTSFLLQEIEGYDGVALLSTNLLNNFDDAFLRRLHYIVRFGLPDPALREQLWQRALPEGRRAKDIPFPLLAQVELSPARIFSAARGAAVAAMVAGKERIDTIGIARALRLELEKSGKTPPRTLIELENDLKGDA